MCSPQFGILALFLTFHSCICVGVLKQFSVNLTLLLCRDILVLRACVVPMYTLFFTFNYLNCSLSFNLLQMSFWVFQRYRIFLLGLYYILYIFYSYIWRFHVLCIPQMYVEKVFFLNFGVISGWILLIQNPLFIRVVGYPFWWKVTWNSFRRVFLRFLLVTRCIFYVLECKGLILCSFWGDDYWSGGIVGCQ